jgi:phospholipase C
MSPAALAAPRAAGSLPFPNKPAGTVNTDMPFDHIVVVMMENHSFDNLLGAMPGIDGLTFDAQGNAMNTNPGAQHTAPVVTAFPFPDTRQAKNVSQSWKATHEQIDGGQMDGFVKSTGAVQPMGYYTQATLPFAYSLASAFTVGTRWFCSMPGPTYPNRRFLLAGTAWGGTTTSPSTLLDPPPPHGTIFDSMSAHRITWANYFSDLPMTAVIPSIILKHSEHLHQLEKFFHDCQSGTLPSVSFVDPSIGVLSSIGLPLATLPAVIKDTLQVLGADFNSSDPASTEEDPQDMYWGELWAYKVIEAVLKSPAWPRILLIYIYDEHGGYYDHVPPPAAIPPDAIPPQLQPGDPPGGYDLYGPRVPAIVVSPYAKTKGVTDTLHDHTSVLATIEAKWNLPALTDRDANAAHVMDFLGLATPQLDRDPIVPPSDTGPSGPVTPTATEPAPQQQA